MSSKYVLQTFCLNLGHIDYNIFNLSIVQKMKFNEWGFRPLNFWARIRGT